MIVCQLIVLRMRSVTDKCCRENQNTHFMFKNFFFLQKFCHLWDNVEKYGRARNATDDNIIWHMCFPFWINKARIQEHKIYNTCCFSLATMVMRMCLSVLLYIPGLSCCSVSLYTFYDLQERHMNCIHLQAANQVL